MTLTDILVTFAVFGVFFLIVWSSLVKKNHPIVQKVREWNKKPKEKIDMLTESEKWNQPSIDKKIY